jgi:hypothetical protein
MFVMRPTNEDYREAYSQPIGSGKATSYGGNLTLFQWLYAMLWPRLKPALIDGRDMSAVVMAFKGSMIEEFEGKKVMQRDKPIRPWTATRWCYLLPIPNRLAFGDSQSVRNRLKYRLHFGDVAADLTHGSLYFGGKHAVGNRYFQADGAKKPLQDHPVFDDMVYDPGSIGGLIAEAANQESGQLVSTIPGNLTLIPDNLHLRVTVGGEDIYRFAKQDRDAVEFLKTSGNVDVGEIIGKLTRKVEYLRAQFDEGGKPRIDLIGGDVLSATRRPIHIAMLVKFLERMLDYLEAKWHSNQVPADSLLDFDDICPRHLIGIPTSIADERRQRGWKPNASFKEQLCRAVSPEGRSRKDGFFVRAPFDGQLVDTTMEGDFGYLKFVGSNGHTEEMVVPSCAVLRVEGNKPEPPFEVKAGQVIGDYMPRAYYEDYQQMIDVVGEGAIVKIEDEFFESLIKRPGRSAWSGNGVGLDVAVAGEALARYSTGDWLDFSHMDKWFNEEEGVYLCPALPWSLNQNGFNFKANGVFYSMSPLGPKFDRLVTTVEGMVEKTSRRHWTGSNKPKSAKNRRPQKAGTAKHVETPTQTPVEVPEVAQAISQTETADIVDEPAVS